MPDQPHQPTPGDEPPEKNHSEAEVSRVGVCSVLMVPPGLTQGDVRAVLDAIEAAGWQCVPKECDHEMFVAAKAQLEIIDEAQEDGSVITGIDGVYDAIEAALAAAPKPEVGK